MKNGKRLTRVYPERKAGRFNKSAPYWMGERAEKIVARRKKEYDANKKTRRVRKATSRQGAIETPSKDGPARHSRTPSQELRRLERALGRRKTLAARQRLRIRIAELKRELGE